MSERHFFMLRVRSGGEFASGYTMTEVAERVGVHPELLDRFVRLGLLECTGSTTEGEFLFGPEAVDLVGRILRLRNELGVNYSGVGVIIDLMARIERLESRVRELEEARWRESVVRVQ